MVSPSGVQTLVESPPLFAGPLYGIRVWHASWEGGDVHLTGFNGERWVGGGAPTHAECVRDGRTEPDHHAPVASCTCGLHAVHPDEDGARWIDAYSGYGATPSLVGIIAAWGTIEVHADGFRAESARPVAICMPAHARPGSDLARLAQTLADRYDAELLPAASGARLVALCHERGYGLDPALVENLISTPGPSTPTPRTPTPRRTPSRWERVGELLGTAFLGLLALAWYGFVAYMAVAIVIGLVREFTSDPSPEFANAHMEITEQAVLPGDDGLRYVALVENTSEKRVAIAAFARGSLKIRGRRVPLSGRDEFDLRPTIAPGQVGLIIDDVEVPDEVKPGTRVRLEGKIVARREPAVERPLIEAVDARFDPETCRLSIAVRSEVPLERPTFAVVGRNGDGKIVGAGSFVADGVDAGRSRLLVDEGGRESCPSAITSVDAFPSAP